ncbi:hypothetical protein ACFQXA_13105 [Nocardiopsis composta]
MPAADRAHAGGADHVGGALVQPAQRGQQQLARALRDGESSSSDCSASDSTNSALPWERE